MTADARTIPARGSIAALLVLADRALERHEQVSTSHDPTRSPQQIARRTARYVDSIALRARRDALADAYRCVVADELGVQFMLLDLPGLRDHAQQTVARVDAL